MRGVKGEIKAGELRRWRGISMPKWGDRERRGETVVWLGSGGMGKGEEVDRRGPRVSERRERRQVDERHHWT
jgi:hypothetical protein